MAVQCILPSSSIKKSATWLTIVTTFVFFLLLRSPAASPPPTRPSSTPLSPRRSLYTNTTSSPSCSNSDLTDSDGLLNYFSLHFCLFGESQLLSIPFLTILVLLQFYILVKTAQDRFSVVVTKLCTRLNLTPSMGAVTLLALGNGAPDVFASVAAVSGGQPRTGFGAILSAGTFVSAFVVGFVAIYAAPFSVEPGPFIRDVLFYLIAAMFLFYVYLSAEIFLWQALGFLCFYLFFVGIVFWMDLGTSHGKGRRKGMVGESGSEMALIGDEKEQMKLIEIDSETGKVPIKQEFRTEQSFGLWKILRQV